MLAYDYPILGVFWTMLIFFLWFAWLMLLFKVFADIFRSEDLGGFSKGLWTVGVIILPFLGVFIYVIARGQVDGRAGHRPARRRTKRRSGRTSRTRQAAALAPLTSSPGWHNCATAACSPKPSSPSRRPSCWPEPAHSARASCPTRWPMHTSRGLTTPARDPGHLWR